MKKVRKQSGFSLTEMLLATAIMAIGLVLIATIFPVGVKLTGLAAQRSVASVVADEAFAKVRLYGLRDFANWPSAQIETAAGNPTYAVSADVTYNACDVFKYTTKAEVFSGPDNLWETEDDWYFSSGPNGLYESSNAGKAGDDVPLALGPEFAYPSTIVSVEEAKKYYWSALCRRESAQEVQVTVFVTHRTFDGMRYYACPYDSTGPGYGPVNTATWPVPVPVTVQYNYDPADTTRLKELVIVPNSSQACDWDTLSGLSETTSAFFDEGCTIINGRDGKRYRVLEMTDADGDAVRETIVLYQDWQWTGYPIAPSAATTWTETVWVVPPGLNSDRDPCIEVFQETITFDEIN